MSLKDKLLNPSLPVTFLELVPPAADKPAAIDLTLAEVSNLRRLVDAINLPEVRDESRGTPRTHRYVPRMEPRLLGSRIVRELGMEAVVNRCVVYEPDQSSWFKETYERFGVSNLVLVGGESSERRYLGPSVLDAAGQAQSLALPICLGGISIPSRLNEADRIRRKTQGGIVFYTTQVLFDSNDIVWLIQRLNGLGARVFLSFAPVTQRRDLDFLRWLGADIPSDLDRFLLGTTEAPADAEACLGRSLDLAQRILMDVFDNLPPDPPPLGLNVEHINRRNFAPAVRMLERLAHLYSDLVAARARV